MKLSLPGAGFLRHAEGFEPKWYRDPVNVGTIGIGFTWNSVAFRTWWAQNKPGVAFGPGATMTREEADACLIYVFHNEYGQALSTFLAKLVPQHVFDGSGSAVFNMGPGSLKWKWAAALRAGNLTEAAQRLRNTGTTGKVPGGKSVPLRGLVIRRKEEAELILTGDYAYGNTVPTAAPGKDPLADGVLVRGERGSAVAELQKRLTHLSYYSGAPDGIFGYGTEAAVLAFQRFAGLTADGYAGPKTLAALDAHYKAVPPVVDPVVTPPPPDIEPIDETPAQHPMRLQMTLAGWAIVAVLALAGVFILIRMLT